MTLSSLQKYRPGLQITSLMVMACLAWSCGSGVDRHLDRAEKLMSENRTREALIEFHAAARLEPENVDLSLRVAEISAELGYYGDATAFYRDAFSLRPDDLEIAIRLTRLLARTDPDESKIQLQELIDKHPKNARIWLLRAELALLRNDTDAALGYVYQARRIAPQDPEVDWTLASANEAISRNARIKNPLSQPSPRHWHETLAAYDRYLASSGERRPTAFLRRAAALTRIPGQASAALLAHTDLLDQLGNSDDPAHTIRVANQVYTFALGLQDMDLAQRAIDEWLSVSPGHPDAWRKQVALFDKVAPEQRDEAYRRMLESSGNQIAVQVVYAEHLTQAKGINSGLGHLKNQLTDTPADDALLAALIDLQQRNGRLRDSAKALREFQGRFPGDPRFEVLSARQALLSTDYAGAEAIVNRIPSERRDRMAYQILAHAQMKQNRNDQALEAIEQAMAMANEIDPANLRLKAQIQFNRRKYRGAAAALIQLQRITGLNPSEQIRLASAYYDSLASGIGRKLLRQMLTSNPTTNAVALEFYRRERSNPKERALLERVLEDARKRDPSDMDVLNALSDLDLTEGNPERALRRVDAVIAEANWLGPPYLARARIHLSRGRAKLARDDAERARRLTPAISEEAFEIQALAHLASPNPSRPIEDMEKKARDGSLSGDQLALLARLQLHSGNPKRALELYERALASGTRLNHVKNDLALLLAESETDLARAEALAKAAVAASGKQINAIDTLGFVYLKRGRPSAAYWQFRYAITNADTPTPDYHYHLALALLAMERDAEANEALQQALALDPTFEPAKQLNTRLNAGDSKPAVPSAETS